jgi:hypothetical protein
MSSSDDVTTAGEPTDGVEEDANEKDGLASDGLIGLLHHLVASMQRRVVAPHPFSSHQAGPAGHLNRIRHHRRPIQVRNLSSGRTGVNSSGGTASEKLLARMHGETDCKALGRPD